MDLAEHRRSVAARAGCESRPGDVVPNPGPQIAFLRSPADEVLYGGAAGGGKSFALLLWALRHVHVKGYRALLLRRQFPQLRRTLLRGARELYRQAGGRWIAGEKTWLFPSGATVEFGSADKESDVERYAGAEFAAIGFDEVTYFTPDQYRFLLSRLRTTVPGLPTRIRAASNPGGPSHDFFLRRFAPWLYPPGEIGYDGRRAAPGEVLWFRPIPDSDEEVIVPPFSYNALSRTFIGAKVQDTPQLAGTSYETNLEGLDRLTRKRLKNGDWMAREAAGEYFQRSWFEVIDEEPSDLIWVMRYWDLASTPEKKATPTSAWTAGLKLGVTSRGAMVILHVERGQWSPGDVETTIANVVSSDEAHWASTETMLERDPAQAGAFQAFYFGREYGIKTTPPNGDKRARALRASAQAEAGNIKILRGAWNEPLLRELESFPETTKDQTDCLSGAVRKAMIVTERLRRQRQEAGGAERRRARASS